MPPGKFLTHLPYYPSTSMSARSRGSDNAREFARVPGLAVEEWQLA